jgi:hypothetical protein
MFKGSKFRITMYFIQNEYEFAAGNKTQSIKLENFISLDSIKSSLNSVSNSIISRLYLELDRFSQLISQDEFQMQLY